MGKGITSSEDIYRFTDPEDSFPGGNPARLAEEVRRRLRRQFFFNLLFGGLSVALVLVLAWMVIRTYRMTPDRRGGAGPIRLLEYAPAYALPPEERWVLEYRQATSDLEGAVVPENAPLSVRWILHAAYHLVSGELALQVGRPQDAQVHLENVLRIFPLTEGVRRLLGSAYVEQQQYHRAVPLLRRALDEKRSLDVLINLGVALANSGHMEEGEQVLLDAVQDPDAPAFLHKNLALLYREMKETEKAEEQFARYLEQVPDDMAALRMYTDDLIAQGRADEAIEVVQGVATADSAPVLLILARTAAAAGLEEKAVEALSHASRRMSPRLVRLEMNDPVFDAIRNQESFRALARQMEIETVAPSVRHPENAGDAK